MPPIVTAARTHIGDEGGDPNQGADHGRIWYPKDQHSNCAERTQYNRLCNLSDDKFVKCCIAYA